VMSRRESLAAPREHAKVSRDAFAGATSIHFDLEEFEGTAGISSGRGSISMLKRWDFNSICFCTSFDVSIIVQRSTFLGERIIRRAENRIDEEEEINGASFLLSDIFRERYSPYSRTHFPCCDPSQVPSDRQVNSYSPRSW
jgi:hypothetical protein